MQLKMATTASYRDGSDIDIMYITETFHSPTNVSILNESVCDSNSSQWLLTSPVCSTKYGSMFAFLTVAVLLSIITCITIFGNLLVLVALYRFKKLRSMSNCLIGNLAVSDLLLALSVLPISTTTDLLGHWVFGKMLCIVWLCIDVLCCTASIWGLCTIAVDRYQATCYPVWYHENKSSTRALVYIIFVWLFSIIISVAPFIGWRDMIPHFYQYNGEINKQDCVLFMSESYVVYSAMGSFVIPTFLMVFLYVRIFTVLKKRMRSMKPKKKRILYPSESDFESEAPGQDGSSDNKSDIELRAASTQTTPSGNKNNNGKEVTEQSPDKAMNGINSTEHKHSEVNRANNKNSHKNRRYSDSKRISLNTEITELSELCVGTNGQQAPINIQSNDLTVPKPAVKQKNCNLKVNFDNKLDATSRSPSYVSRRSFLLNDESDDYENKYSGQRKQSRVMFLTSWNNPLTKGHKHQVVVKQKYELREQRATKRMAMIMACFCFCWWPFLFMYVIRSFCKACTIDMHFQAAIIWLGYANSSINPVLYTIFNEDFRKAFQRIVFCKKNSRHRR